MEETIGLVEKYSSQARVPGPADRVYKDECVYSYDTSESPDGLFTCLNTFISVSREALPIHFSKTQSHLYLHVKTYRREIVSERGEDEEPEKKKPSKLGIGIDGGFDLTDNKFYFENDYSLYVFPEDKFLKLEPANEQLLSEKVRASIESIKQAESITQKEELAAQASAWDGTQRFVTKHSATLQQASAAPQISPDPNSWKCEQCDVRQNLWLNLTDGKVLCGRRQLDGTGGNNHAIEHYQKTKYPLAVKLGTITANGADVYSYDEDDMVDDSNLAVHLAHFGINMSKMQKTEKTMTELEIDLNQKVGEWDRIQESGSKLVSVYGEGLTGMRNLGNSCYMNSVMQTLFLLPEFADKYAKTRDERMRTASIDPSNDFNFQMSKLGHGLLSGLYSQPPAEDNKDFLKPPKGIKPASFKTLIGRGHPEFSTKRQQDAHEYLTYLFSLIERNQRTDHSSAKHLNPLDIFKFKLVDRFECSQSHQVKYKPREELCLSMPISKSLAINKEKLAEFEKRKHEAESQGLRLEPGDLVRPEIRLEDCLRLFAQNELISDFYSSTLKAKVNATKQTLFGTFPDYLLIHARKFEHAADWTPIKLDVSLLVPDVLDLSEFRSSGLKESEIEMLDDDDESASGQLDVELNQNLVQQLIDMGFSLEGSRRAVYNTREANDAEAAVNWAVMHMEEPDFNLPFEMPSSGKKSAGASKSYDEEKIESILMLGFTRQQAIKALESTQNNLERAVDWIFNHPDELMDTSEAPSSHASSNALESQYRDGNGLYQLIGFISHMGPNANVGHYVCHLLKNSKWTIFNDENVALSENPPKDLAYVYLYKRIN